MQVLYKDEEGFLAVMEVTKAAYIEDEELMEICGPEEDIAVAIDAKSAEKAIRELYANGKADLSAYEYQDRDFDDDDFDDDDEDDEDRYGFPYPWQRRRDLQRRRIIRGDHFG